MEQHYEVNVDGRVLKSIRQILPKHQKQSKASLEKLRATPRPQDSIKLPRGYRVTVGEYRILYTVDDEARLVTVYKIVKRNDYSYRD